MKLRSGNIITPPSRKTTTARSRPSTTTVQSKEIKYDVLSSSDVIKPRAENRTKQLNRKSGFLIVYTALLAIVFLVLFMFVFIYCCSWDTRTNADQAETFSKGLNLLRAALPEQNDRVWDILRTRGRAHLNNSPPLRPLVFLFAAPADGHDVASCLAIKLAGLIDPPSINKQLLIINGSKYKSWKGNKAKLELDQLLKNFFLNGLKVAIIENLEVLPPTSPLLFYSYCDDENAPFKAVSIIFTVHLPWHFDSFVTPKENERRVETYLANEVWKSPLYEENAVGALLSRVADTVVLLHSEDKSVLAKVCPK